jgi:hypothetical protein
VVEIRSARSSTAARASSFVAVSIAARTSPFGTPSARAAAHTPLRSFTPDSATRFTALAVIPSTTRRIAPNSSTIRNATSGDKDDASKSRAMSSRELRAETSEANIYCPR